VSPKCLVKALKGALDRLQAIIAPLYSAVEHEARDENCLYDIAMDMEPEDGCLTVLDIDDMSTIAFTERGVEILKELLDDLKA
jgi:putative methionine-R-sulfoxide reductase with GAF domain